MTERTRYPKEVSTSVTMGVADRHPPQGIAIALTDGRVMQCSRKGREKRGADRYAIAQSTRQNATNINVLSCTTGPCGKGCMLRKPGTHVTGSSYRPHCDSLRSGPLVFWFHPCVRRPAGPGPRSESGAGTSSCRRRRLATPGKLTVRRPPHPC
ncbi:hypothetical protein PHLGIDRAFT_420840 [Phlebiopsis gigantea 11061_1 CR5-6]|uniref:Uncharacterized protein n=1 Tax=Phlebiopsis gigantea (strain 11061_1 CR5-6) TaxID=745531 RepID=A0A0C3PLQ5_PHLG1|nr:hypothetical protein PHLGIDRAFT_420840 [Phlebiopsis gigantea 11061_1 CR5-6]